MKNKNNKGLTLVEILVSVVISVLIVTYGVSLFIAAWHMDTDSSDYHIALTYAANEVELAKSLWVASKDNLEALFINHEHFSIDGEYLAKDFRLPSNKILNMKIKIYDELEDNEITDSNGDPLKLGIFPISVIATWGGVDNQKEEKIAINAYIGSNDTFSVFDDNGN